MYGKVLLNRGTSSLLLENPVISGMRQMTRTRLKLLLATSGPVLNLYIIRTTLGNDITIKVSRRLA